MSIRHPVTLGVTVLVLAAAPIAGRAAKTTPGERCAVAKLKAAFKKAAAKGACYEKAVSANTAVDAACLTKADEKFGAAFQKAETKGGCATVGDATNVEGLVDACVGNVVAALPATPTTSTSTTTTTTLVPCGSAEAPACNGSCPPEHQCAFLSTQGICVCGAG